MKYTIKIPGKFSLASVHLTFHKERASFLHKLIERFIGNYKETSLEVTVPHNNWYARYKGEFQNMGPKMHNPWTPSKDPAWLQAIWFEAKSKGLTL